MQPLTGRHLVHFAGLPLLLFTERSVHYGLRAVLLPVLMTDGELHELDATDLYGTIAWVAAVSPVIGGVLAALIGPYATLALGGLVCAVAIAGISLLPDAAWALMMLLSVGQGIIKPAVWVLAAFQLFGGRSFGRAALFTALYVSVNAAAFVAPLLVPPLWTAVGTSAVFAVGAAAMIVVALLALVLWGFGRRQKWPEPSLAHNVETVGFAVGIALLVLPLYLLVGVAGTSTWMVSQSAGLDMTTVSMIQVLNPVLVLGGGAVVVLMWTAAQAGGLKVPDLVFAGFAMVAVAVGTLVAHPWSVGMLGVTALGASTAALALCEVVAIPIAMSRVAGGSHWRLAPLLLATWFIGSALMAWGGGGLATRLGAEWALPFSAFVTLVAGLVMAVGGIAGRRALLRKSGVVLPAPTQSKAATRAG